MSPVIYFLIGFPIGVAIYMAAYYVIGERKHRRKNARLDAEALAEVERIQRRSVLVGLRQIELRYGVVDLLTDAERAEIGGQR